MNWRVLTEKGRELFTKDLTRLNTQRQPDLTQEQQQEILDIPGSGDN